MIKFHLVFEESLFVEFHTILNWFKFPFHQVKKLDAQMAFGQLASNCLGYSILFSLHHQLVDYNAVKMLLIPPLPKLPIQLIGAYPMLALTKLGSFQQIEQIVLVVI